MDCDDRPRRWPEKFRDAFRGLRAGLRGQSSFRVHGFAAAMVVAAAAALNCDRLEWCLLLISITLVLAAEMLNSGLESMAKAIEKELHPHLADALDIGSAAVLIASIGAATVGTIVFGHRLGVMLAWW